MTTYRLFSGYPSCFSFTKYGTNIVCNQLLHTPRKAHRLSCVRYQTGLKTQWNKSSVLVGHSTKFYVRFSLKSEDLRLGGTHVQLLLTVRLNAPSWVQIVIKVKHYDSVSITPEQLSFKSEELLRGNDANAKRRLLRKTANLDIMEPLLLSFVLTSGNKVRVFVHFFLNCSIFYFFTKIELRLGCVVMT